MKADLYTKAVLTIIAIMLVVIVARPYIGKPVAPAPPAPFTGVQFTGPTQEVRCAPRVHHSFDVPHGRVMVYDIWSGCPQGTYVFDPVSQRVSRWPPE